MTEIADLLMPKLGLTMTEGTVARWIAAPGQRFAAGDVVVIVETDKIANEVEAPLAGELVALLSPEGAVVPVGTPIAQWRLNATSIRPEKPRVQAEAPARVSASAVQAPVMPSGDVNRVIATPYARRLAREAGLDLGCVAGSGPRGRIKAEDVTRALEAQAARQSVVPAGAAAPLAAPAPALRAAPSFVTADVDVTALRALDARLAGSRDRPFERRTYIVLACIKALDTQDGTPVRLGFQIDGELSTLEGTTRDTLSAVAGRLAHPDARDAGGNLAISVVEGRAHLLVPAVPQGWRMALGIGGVRTLRGGDTTHEMTLALAYYGATMDHESAARLLDRIAALLEEPLHLLAG